MIKYIFGFFIIICLLDMIFTFQGSLAVASEIRRKAYNRIQSPPCNSPYSKSETNAEDYCLEGLRIISTNIYISAIEDTIKYHFSNDYIMNTVFSYSMKILVTLIVIYLIYCYVMKILLKPVSYLPLTINKNKNKLT